MKIGLKDFVGKNVRIIINEKNSMDQNVEYIAYVKKYTEKEKTLHKKDNEITVDIMSTNKVNDGSMNGKIIKILQLDIVSIMII